MGLVGAGFVGPHHIDAVRRLGFVDVVAIATSSDASAREKAQALHVPKAFGRYEALIDDPDVHVVHIATPNHLHYPVAMAAIRKGKHVVSDKPLATTSHDAQRLVDEATRAGIIHAVTFNYRGNPLVQEARQRIARGEIGPPYFIHGCYLQDWLLEPDDYSWRLDPKQGGDSSAMADIGSHWFDLAEHLTRLRITEVLASMRTVVPQRQKPSGAREAFEKATGQSSASTVTVTAEDLGSVLLRFDSGATGTLSVGQVCAGHKNDLSIEMCGAAASIRWDQQQQNELWIGHRHQANERLEKDPSLVGAEVRRYARLPGGHQEGWADAFYNVIQDIYECIAGRWAPITGQSAFATFDDGLRSVRIVEAVLASARAGSVWTAV